MSQRILDILPSVHRKFHWPSGWSWEVLGIVVPVALPMISILWYLFFATPTDVWAHLRENVLFNYIANTVSLLIIVGMLSGILGVGCAWLTATKEFPGRKIFVWSLILPLTAPAYVVAYAYADFLAYTGSLQVLFRDLGFGGVGLPSIRSIWGAGLILGLTLYPYVYLLAYNAFAEQAGPLSEAARTLGVSRRRAFFKIALPHARPAIAGGLALVLMETAADFGVVDFFGVPTLTNGIFRTWYAMGEHQAAMQLAGWLFMIVVVLVVLEQLARRGRHANPVARNAPPSRSVVRGWLSLIPTFACALPLVLGLLLPAFILIRHAIFVGDPTFGMAFSDYVSNTVLVGAVAALLAAFCALLLSYAVRLQDDRWTMKVGVRVATLGYAIPGMVLAIGIIGPLTAFDRTLAGWIEGFFELNVGLLLTGSLFALVLVYLARFLAVAFNSVDGGMSRIHANYDDAARVLGSTPRQVMRRVHLPLLMPAFLTAMLLVFVDVVKELPATLILRPFNFETLATRAYRLASDERIAEASTACLLIVLVGLIPTILLAMQNFGLQQRRSSALAV